MVSIPCLSSICHLITSLFYAIANEHLKLDKELDRDWRVQDSCWASWPMLFHARGAPEPKASSNVHPRQTFRLSFVIYPLLVRASSDVWVRAVFAIVPYSLQSELAGQSFARDLDHHTRIAEQEKMLLQLSIDQNRFLLACLWWDFDWDDWGLEASVNPGASNYSIAFHLETSNL